MTPCLPWAGPLDAYGYGRAPKSVKAHRMAYVAAFGAIPHGMELDHLCRNRACVNPDHLEPVTHRVNVLRGTSPTAINAAKVSCVRGHPYDAMNTRVGPDGKRYCRACHRDSERSRRQAGAELVQLATKQLQMLEDNGGKAG